MIDELTDYLDRESSRVRVDDTLADIESGVRHVVVAPRRRGRWYGPALVGAAAAAVVLVGVGVGGDERGGQTEAALGAAAPIPVDAPSAPAPAPLPDGATMQGFTPLCTTLDGLEFDCAVEGYRQAGGYDDGGFDHTGELQNVVDADAVVMGACRSTSPDGSAWHCALGQRAVELDLLLAETLGQESVIGYAAG